MCKSEKSIRGLGVTLIFSLLILFSCTSTKVAQNSRIVTQGDEQADPMGVDNPQKPVIMAEIPPVAAEEIEFYRLNIFKEGYYSQLKLEKESISQHTAKRIYLVNNGIEWFLQAGEYSTFEDAIKEKEILNSLGWLDIRILRYRGVLSQGVEAAEPRTIQQKPVQITGSFVYTVQVVATKNKDEAETLKKNLEMLEIKNTHLINEAELWKLQVGSYGDYNSAAQMLRQIREMGFSDSWITRRQVKK